MVVAACQWDLANHPVPPWPCANCTQDAFAHWVVALAAAGTVQEALAQVGRTWVWTWGALCTTSGMLQDVPQVVATHERSLQGPASPVAEERP